MTNRFFLKLKSKAGESLIESLAAILIFVMASIIMYSMVTASADINMTAKKNDAKVYEELLVAEMGPDGTATPIEETVSMTITDGTNTHVVAGGKVEIYGTPGTTLYAYYANGGTGNE